MRCCMCGFKLKSNYYHLVERGQVFCSIECLKDNYEEIYERYEGHEDVLQIESPNMTFGDAIIKLKEGAKVRKVDWDESHYIYMDEEGYVRRRDGKKYFIKLNNDVWEEFK